MKIAFWLQVTGRASKAIPKDLEDGRIFIGRRESPVAIIRRKEIPGYMTQGFYELFTFWTRVKDFGLPLGGAWLDYPETFVRVLELFNSEWRLAGAHSR